MSDKEEELHNQFDDIKSFIGGDWMKENVKPNDEEKDEQYLVGDIIASGGIKDIRKVRDRRSGRDLAMAKLKHNLINPMNQERFLREARILAGLEHSNIVPIHDINYDNESQLYFTMKLLSGETLASILKKSKQGDQQYQERYSLKNLLGIFVRICDAISYAHSKDIAHLDIKPENIQISEYGEVSIIDWGMAKRFSEDPQTNDSMIIDIPAFTPLTYEAEESESIGGTPGYMSPEQTDNKNGTIGKASDIYSLGATLYAILYKSAPHQKHTIEEVLRKTKEGVAPEFPSQSLGNNIPPALIAVIKKAMSKNPDDRYADVNTLKKEIELYLNDFSTHAEDISIARILTLFIKRHYIASIITLIFTLLITVISYISLNAIYERERKINATAAEVIYGIDKIESEFRLAWEYDKAIAHYHHLFKLGYEYPEFKYRLARLYAGNLELKKCLTYLDEISKTDNKLVKNNEFISLRETVKKYYNLKLTLNNCNDVGFYAKVLPEDIKHHVFATVNRNPALSLEQILNKIRKYAGDLDSKERFKNYKYEIRDGKLYIDLSNNPTFRDKAFLMGLNIYSLDISNTNTSVGNFFVYNEISNNLKELYFSRCKHNFSHGHLSISTLRKLVVKNGNYVATGIHKNPHLIYLDVEGSNFHRHIWKASENLEFLNIAYTKFENPQDLWKFSSLKTLIIDKGIKIPESTLKKLKNQKVNIVIKK